MKSTTSLEHDLRTVGQDVEGLLGGVAREGSATAARVFDTARVRLSDADVRLRDQARRAASAAEDYVHEHPWRSLGAGALIGLVAGLLLARR